MARPAFAFAGRTSPVRKFHNLAVYACEGLVIIQDDGKDRNGEVFVVLPDDMMVRIRANERYVRGWRNAEKGWMKEEFRTVMKACQDFHEVVKEAKAMGDPSDPAVRAFWARHKPGRKSTVSLRAGQDKAGYPELPRMPIGNFTGRDVFSDGVAVIPPNVSAAQAADMVIHKAPRRKNRAGLILDL